jgi:8-oxo-dGTP diphosphatase
MRIVGVGGVLTNGAGQVLLVRTPTAGWELPGGRVESGEDLIRALEREVREEAGCDVTPDRLVGAYAHVAQDLLILIIRGTSTTDVPRPSVSEDKVLEARWFSPEDALRNVTHEREHQALADALSGAAAVVYRAYDLT